MTFPKIIQIQDKRHHVQGDNRPEKQGVGVGGTAFLLWLARELIQFPAQEDDSKKGKKKKNNVESSAVKPGRQGAHVTQQKDQGCLRPEGKRLVYSRHHDGVVFLKFNGSGSVRKFRRGFAGL